MKRNSDPNIENFTFPTKRLCARTTFEHVIFGSQVVKQNFLQFLDIKDVMFFRGVNRNCFGLYSDIRTLNICNIEQFLLCIPSPFHFECRSSFENTEDRRYYCSLEKAFKEPIFSNVTTLRVNYEEFHTYYGEISFASLRITSEQFPRLRHLSFESVGNVTLYIDPRIQIHTLELKGCWVERVLFNINTLKVLYIDGSNDMPRTIYTLACLFKHTLPSSLECMILENILFREEKWHRYSKSEETFNVMFPESEKVKYKQFQKYQKYVFDALMNVCPKECKIKTKNIREEISNLLF